MIARDPFLELARSARPKATAPGHAERAHSKFSASGSKRWLSCPGSVTLEEGQPDKTSEKAAEGTQAHEVLEKLIELAIGAGDGQVLPIAPAPGVPPEMHRHGVNAANFILGQRARLPDAEFMVETRVYLDFIHPEMFGTFDSAIVDHFGTLHVFDFKYGLSPVSPKSNLQMIFYAIGMAHKHQWNFKRARLWIVQPRIRGYAGPVYWDVPIADLRRYVDVFRAGAERAERETTTYVEGDWCFFCKAKGICPLKREVKFDKARAVFLTAPLPKEIPLDGPEEVQEENADEEAEEVQHGRRGMPRRHLSPESESEEDRPLKSEAEWRKEARKARGKKGRR